MVAWALILWRHGYQRSKAEGKTLELKPCNCVIQEDIKHVLDPIVQVHNIS